MGGLPPHHSLQTKFGKLGLLAHYLRSSYLENANQKPEKAPSPMKKKKQNHIQTNIPPWMAPSQPGFAKRLSARKAICQPLVVQKTSTSSTKKPVCTAQHLVIACIFTQYNAWYS